MNNSPQPKLTIEQQFTIAAFNSQVDKMSLEQARDMLKLVNQQLEVQRATYCELLKHQWGIGSSELNKQSAEG